MTDIITWAAIGAAVAIAWPHFGKLRPSRAALEIGVMSVGVALFSALAVAAGMFLALMMELA